MIHVEGAPPVNLSGQLLFPGTKLLAPRHPRSPRRRPATFMRELYSGSSRACLQVAFDELVDAGGTGAMACVPSQSVSRQPALPLRVLIDADATAPRVPAPLEVGLSAAAPSPRRHKHRGVLERVPTSSRHAWAHGLRMPKYALGVAALPHQALPSAASPKEGSVRAPVLPTLFVPGFPKSATTWLYSCLTDAFTPRRVGCGPDSNRWNASACGRRFLLTTLTAQRWVRGEFLLEPMKETVRRACRHSRACAHVRFQASFASHAQAKKRRRRSAGAHAQAHMRRRTCAGAHAQAHVRRRTCAGARAQADMPCSARRSGAGIVGMARTLGPGVAASDATLCRTWQLVEATTDTFMRAQLSCVAAPAALRAAPRCPSPSPGRRRRHPQFYFGGSRRDAYRPDLLTLIGPDPKGGALPGEGDLWAWEHRAYRTARSWQRVSRPPPPSPPSPLAGTAATSRATMLHPALRREAAREQRESAQRAAQSDLFERLGRTCRHSTPPCASIRGAARAKRQPPLTGATTPPPSPPPHESLTARLARLDPPMGDCTHAACVRVIHDLPGSSSGKCSWEDRLHTRFGRDDHHCLMSMLPHASQGEYNMVVGDFTPNYLCDADAMPRLARSLPDPGALRFVVVMREPTARAFSEWSMFALQWAWDPIGDFGASLAARVAWLKSCNATLFRDTRRLRSLPTRELRGYLRKCWNHGGAMMYAQTSMYAVCILHALRYFRREQFLFLRYEDLMAMDTEALLALVGRFTGLYVDAKLVAEVKRGGLCTPARRRVSTYSTISPQEKVMYNRSKRYVAADAAALRELFTPYNALLTDLVGHTDFGWPVEV